uniref:Uncharacterized protein n=1 Tax=Ceratitis capitata TaxID=7213 RepID=W8BKQ3_CERCA
MLPPDENCPLDAVVIVKGSSIVSRNSANRSKCEKVGGKGHQRCRCQHGDMVRQRHNATQTPDSILNCSQLHNCHSHSAALNCCGNTKSNDCCGLINGDLRSGEISSHCHITHHCHHYSPGGGGASIDRRKRKLCSCRSHGSRKSNKSQHNHRRKHQPHHHHYHNLQPEFQQNRNKNNNVRQLPGYNSKSSFDSSDDPPQSGLEQPHERLQAIAIEIDAATLTEDNTSTATSNFAYKMAMGNFTPIILPPIHDNVEVGKKPSRKLRKRCDSMNSNSTVETDELSHGNSEDRRNKKAANNSLITGQHKNAHHTFWGSRDINDYNYIRTESKIDGHFEDIIPHACCDDSLCCVTSREMSKRNSAHNECVRIRRKQFRASGEVDGCSTCSHCTNCSCQNADATSCSSFDELDADADNDEEHHMAPHELLVAADCHRCNLRRRSTTSTGEEVEEEDADTDDKLTATNIKQYASPHRLLQDNNTDSSTHTSRRSSASFCSCHSSTCCCCECKCVVDVAEDDCDTVTTGQMLTARDTSCTALTSAAELDAEHSSTLTPLTNASSVVSTPGAEDADVTLRSLNNTLAEDVCSSLSQSAEYFSLSSNNPQSHVSPADTPKRMPGKIQSKTTTTGENIPKSNLVEPTETSETGRKMCKHYGKHHRHKRAGSPLDSYL